MGKKAKRYVAVQAIVSIPKAGEFKVGIMIPADTFMSPPTVRELVNEVDFEVRERLRVKLDKGEHKRFLRMSKASK